MRNKGQLVYIGKESEVIKLNDEVKRAIARDNQKARDQFKQRTTLNISSVILMLGAMAVTSGR